MKRLLLAVAAGAAGIAVAAWLARDVDLDAEQPTLAEICLR